MLHGFGLALPDFAFFVFFAYLADTYYRPASAYRWLFFVLFALIAVLFFLAWIADLGARL